MVGRRKARASGEIAGVAFGAAQPSRHSLASPPSSKPSKQLLHPLVRQQPTLPAVSLALPFSSYPTSKPEMRDSALFCLAFVSCAFAQSCSNYGSGTNCTSCPSGFGGSTCTTLLCSNALEQPQDRPSFSRSLAGDASLGCDLQCSSGWTGPTCSIPVTAAACAGATNEGEPAILSSGAWVWTEGHVSCDVVVSRSF